MTDTTDTDPSDGSAPGVELGHVARLLAGERGLCMVSITRPDGTISTSLVNGGVLAHPVSGAPVIAFVVKASAYKCRRLRALRRATISVSRQWEWQAIEGRAELIGPFDPAAEGSVDVAALLRDVFRSAGGTHDDWDEFDRVMAAEQRTAVLVHPDRVYGNTSS